MLVEITARQRGWPSQVGGQAARPTVAKQPHQALVLPFLGNRPRFSDGGEALGRLDLSGLTLASS